MSLVWINTFCTIFFFGLLGFIVRIIACDAAH